MARVELTDSEVDEPEVREIFNEIREKAGRVPAAYRAFSLHPHILQANWNRTKNILGKGGISLKIKEAIATRVSKVNDCRFCLEIHKNNLKNLGLNLTEIESIENGEVNNEQLNLVLAFVSTATKEPHKLTDDDFTKLKEIGYKDKDIVEILTVMEMYTGYNKIIVALNLQPED